MTIKENIEIIPKVEKQDPKVMEENERTYGNGRIKSG